MNILNDYNNYMIKQEKSKKLEYNSKKVGVRKSHNVYNISACIRQLYYKCVATEESNPSDASSLIKMQMGVYIHEGMQKFLVDIYKAETEVKGEYNCKELSNSIRYSVDAITNSVGIEIKSGFGRGISNIKKEGKPKSEHLEQAIMYLHMKNLDKMIILYIARDSGYRCSFEIVKSDGTRNIFNRLIHKLKGLELLVKEKTIPSREYKVAIKNGEIKDRYQDHNIIHKSDWQCLYCSYKDYCWKDELK